MPSNKFELLKRVKAVEREHTAVKFAADFLLQAARENPVLLDRVLRVRDVEESIEQLEGTYVIRLFAEFEASLRRYWIAARGTDPPSRTRDLLDGIGARRRVPDDTIRNAHSVREFRNGLIHERDDIVVRLPISDARRYLCIFLSFLPLEW
jgi:hypothetical protein